ELAQALGLAHDLDCRPIERHAHAPALIAAARSPVAAASRTFCVGSTAGFLLAVADLAGWLTDLRLDLTSPNSTACWRRELRMIRSCLIIWHVPGALVRIYICAVGKGRSQIVCL